MRSALVSTAAFAMGVMAQSSMTTTPASNSVNTASATIYQAGGMMTNLPGLDLDVEYSVDVVDANNCDTTYHLIATIEQLGPQTLTVVKGSTYQNVNFELKTDGVGATVSEGCTFAGSTTQAICTESYSLSASGITQQSLSTVATTTNIEHATYAINSGGEKLASATGTCTTPGNAAAPTGLVADVYKVVVVPAAAAIAAAALI